MRLSMIRPRWITPSEICIILQIIRKANPILLLSLLLLLLLLLLLFQKFFLSRMFTSIDVRFPSTFACCSTNSDIERDSSCCVVIRNLVLMASWRQQPLLLTSFYRISQTSSIFGQRQLVKTILHPNTGSLTSTLSIGMCSLFMYCSNFKSSW